SAPPLRSTLLTWNKHEKTPGLPPGVFLLIFVEADAAPARPLGGIEGLVRLAEQVVELGAVLGEEGHPDAAADLQGGVHAGDLHRLAAQLSQLVLSKGPLPHPLH